MFKAKHKTKPYIGKKQPKRIRVSAAVLALVFTGCTLFLSGCWDSTDINEQIYVVGAAIDTTESSGVYKYTFQAAIPVGADSAVSENSVSYKSFSVYSTSFSQAVRQLELISSGQPSFEQLNCVILGSDAARRPAEDIYSMLEYLLRWSYARRQALVGVADSTAEELLKEEYISGNASSAASASIERFFGSDRDDRLMTLAAIQTALMRGEDFCLLSLSPLEYDSIADNSLLPLVIPEDESENENSKANAQDSPTSSSDASSSQPSEKLLCVTGMYCYSGGSFCGSLDGEQAELTVLFSPTQSSGLITASEHNGKLHRYQINSSRCTSKCYLANNRLVCDVAINVQCAPVDSGGSDNLLTEETISAVLQKELSILAEECRSKYGSAALGLYSAVRQQQYSKYKTDHDKWRGIWNSSDINITVICRLSSV